jgi:hypothetical protein
MREPKSGRDRLHHLLPLPCFRTQKSVFKFRNAPLTGTLSSQQPATSTLSVHAPQHFLYFLPLPHGQNALRPILGSAIPGSPQNKSVSVPSVFAVVQFLFGWISEWLSLTASARNTPGGVW